ncbi:AAA family ATPase [Exiguobacterium marinum]|uniref:Nuclease SbcCD subunit C n=1 Tax=Exiguobacterium marinum TaxID=273528 RepID=A0ABY7X449_9BACL|nr:AAA family ATPase [Exiguobacterium marinum]WDH76681.1 AAA family ATPase [Exiguobacterium marinum]
MILKRLVLENFRQYYGVNSIHFAYGAEKNVTVIHGENGSGKTALLTALIWGFYGRELKLPNPDFIFNNKAVNKCSDNHTDLKAEVQIQFEHNGYSYELQRRLEAKYDYDQKSLTFPKNKVSNQKVELTKTNLNNKQTTKVRDISYEINRILPYKLHTFFFFDGERMDHLGKKEAYSEIRDSIKRMMGLELFDNSIDHLNKTIVKLRDEVSKNVEGELSQKYSRVNELEKAKSAKKEKLYELEAEVSAAKKELSSVEDALRDGAETRKYQINREKLLESISSTKQAFDKKMKELGFLLSRSGSLAFSSLAIKRFERIAQKDRSEEIEKLIHPDLIPSLLSREECICGHRIDEEAQRYLTATQQEVMELSETKNEVDQLLFQLSGWDVSRDNFYREIRRHLMERESMREKIRVYEEELREIEEHMKSNARNIEDSKQLIERESSIQKAIIETEAKIEHLKEALSEFKKEEEQLQKELGKLSKAEERQHKFQIALASANKIKETLTGLLKLRESQVRTELEEKIKTTYAKLLRKDYTISLTDHYELLVTDSQGKHVGLSQGESQITSLAFIGAIVDLTREYQVKEKGHALDEELKLGNIYPLVMDSPFGALDADHRSRVATNLPLLSEQVVVIVSTSQWRGEVESATQQRIGSAYRLVNHINDTSGERTEILEVY